MFFFSYFNQVNVRRIKNTESKVSISLLIKFNLNKFNISTLNYAYENGNKEIIQLLLNDNRIEFIENVLSRNSKIREISIPSFITKIGNRAFNGCSLLAKITIPSSVESIGENCLNSALCLMKSKFLHLYRLLVGMPLWMLFDRANYNSRINQIT